MENKPEFVFPAFKMKVMAPDVYFTRSRAVPSTCVWFVKELKDPGVTDSWNYG
jgi:hypothetical protein